MVTADRPQLCRRAILSYRKQTYPNKELVVLDNGRESMEELLRGLPPDEVRYLRVERTPDLFIGGLRNMTLEEATGEVIAPQWDDDDWSHPDRLQVQMQVLEEGYEACALSGSLMHMDRARFFDHPFLGMLPRGTAAIHRRDSSIRYPNIPRTSDNTYIHAWMQKRFVKLPLSASYLYVRFFHGQNIWDEEHFLRRMRNTPKDLLAYGWHRYIRRDVLGHPRFRLSQKAQEAFERYLEDSYRVGLFRSAAQVS